MLTRSDAIALVKSFTDELLASGIPLDRVILFGSYSRNAQNEYSDIDVVLVSDLFTGFGFEDLKHFSRINIRREFLSIETKTYSSQYFEQGDPFITEIFRSGIELYNSYAHETESQI